MRMNRVKINRRGAALVEMAIVLALLMLLVFGIVDFGLMFRDYLALSQVAREAARCGALGGDASARINSWATKLGLDPALLKQSITTTGSSPGGEITVSLTYTYHTIVGDSFDLGGLWPLDPSINLKSTMVMRLE